jgi:hypothetical protein
VPEQKIPEQKIIAVVGATGGSRDLDLVRTLNPQLQTSARGCGATLSPRNEHAWWP